MSQYKDEIWAGYETYLEEYPNNKIIDVGGYDYPTQGGALDDSIGEVALKDIITDLERKYLINYRNDIPDVRDLPMEDLAWLPVPLTYSIKIGQNTDHESLWKETVGIVVGLDKEDGPFRENISVAFEALVRTALCSPWEGSEQNVTGWDLRSNVHYLLIHAQEMARYMAFPLIEAVVKDLLKNYISREGVVREGKQVRKYDGWYTEGDEVSNLGHLLYHLEMEVANEVFQNSLEMYRDAVESFFGPGETHWPGSYGYLYQQRSSIVHGGERTKAEFRILLNLLSLLVLNVDNIENVE